MYDFPVTNEGIGLRLRSHLNWWASAGDSRADPLGAYNTHISGITRALDQLLQVLAVEASSRPAALRQRGQLDGDVLRTFQDLTYRLAEFYDFLTKRLTKALNAEAENKLAHREFARVVSEARRDACLICNKIKHADSVLARVDNLFEGGAYVEGMVLLSRLPGGTLTVCRELHKKNEDGTSFNLGVRSLVFDFLRADIAAGRLCSALGGQQADAADALLLQQLRTLGKRPEVGLSFERARTIRAMWEQPGKLVAGMKVRELPPRGERVQIIQTIGTDGHTRTFPLAG